MNLKKIKEETSRLIAEGLTNKYFVLKPKLIEEGFYAYTLYCASGFVAMGISASTEQSLVRINEKLRKSHSKVLEMLKEHPDLLEKYNNNSPTDNYATVTADEWEYKYGNIPEYENLNALVNDIYEYSYEEVTQEFDVQQYLSEIIIEGLKLFKQSIKNEKDMLLGLQFSDPSADELVIMEQVSKVVNSMEWHEKLIQEIRKES